MYKDNQGRFLTQGLFFETSLPSHRDKYEVPFTLKEQDHEVDGTVYMSMRRLYLQYMDPTEYSFAMGVLGSWEHWKRLKQSAFFLPYYKSWNEELTLKLQSVGIRTMLEEASSDGRSKATAAKWLAECGWDASNKKGRPNKDTIQKEANKLLSENIEVDELLDHAETIQH